jgi:SAM-dependent methyltransferase
MVQTTIHKYSKMSDPESSQPDPILVQLFQPELKHVPEAMSALLSSYAGIPVDQQKEHITRVRDQAYKSYPYPCLGRWRFLELDVAKHPLYDSTILPMLKENSDCIYLDLGCCLGQDIRKLLFDGVNPAQVYGADLNPEFIDMGYELFRDEDKFPRRDHFVAPADVFDFSSESELGKLCDGKVGVLHSTSVFHLFHWAQQMQMALRCLQLMRRNGKVLICGSQVGNVDAGEYPRRRGGGSRYRHDEASWKKLWDEVVQTEEWRDKIKAVDVRSVMIAHGALRPRDKDAAAQVQAHDGELADAMNSERPHIGPIEQGFRWQKWWVWIEFV